MRINEKLIEQPKHAHYLVCLNRKTEIDRFCHKLFIFSITEAVIFLVMMSFGLWLSALSWIPSLCGKEFTMPNIAAYLIEIILLPVLALISCGKNKICILILFAIQCLVVIGCFFGGLKTINTFPFLIGIIGVFITYPSINAYLDYRQLMKTEGFPQFNNFLADADDNPEFVSSYGKEYYKKGSEKTFINIPEKPSLDIQHISKSESAYMDDIPLINDNSENNLQ